MRVEMGPLEPTQRPFLVLHGCAVGPDRTLRVARAGASLCCMDTMLESLSLGVDLGGTKVEACALRCFDGVGGSTDPGFEVLARERVPTGSEAGYAAVLATTADLVRSVARAIGREPSSIPIGVGMPGAVARSTGLVKNSNTLCLNEQPFREDLSRALGRAVAFENDANCFALAEACLGAARAHAGGLVFGAILGTGVGGGLVIRQELWPGPQQLCGEWGHHGVGPWRRLAHSMESRAGRDLGLGLGERAACYCGKTGCLELYLSGPAVEADYLRRSGKRVTLREIAACGDQDLHAAAALDEMLEAFGRGLANLIDMLDPSAVVLGGGVSNLACLYSEGVRRVAEYVFNDELITPILKHELGDSAGVLGAAVLVAQRR